jgi:hypothetical protein
MKNFTKNSTINLERDIPFYKRREYLLSPFIIPIGVGFILYGIFLLIKRIFYWLMFSLSMPFLNSEWFCKQDFHKYRCQGEINGGWDKLYKCKICGKEKLVDQPD